MSKSLLPGLLVIVAGSTLPLSPSQSPQRPEPEQGASVVDYVPPPATLEALWDAAPVVVRVVPRTSTVKAVPVGSEHFSAVTVHTADVLEVFKNTSTEPVVNEIAINQPGGTVEDHGVMRRAETSSFPIFKAGQELMLFLTPSQVLEGFSVTYGPAGAYVVHGNSVLIPKRTQQYSAFRGRESVEKGEFLQIIQQLKNRQAK